MVLCSFPEHGILIKDGRGVTNRIKELRKNRGITQEDLAKVLNIKRSTLSKYETETIPLTADTISILVDYFNVSTDCLLGRTGIPLQDTKKEHPNSELEQGALIHSNGQPLDEEEQRLLSDLLTLNPENFEKARAFLEFLKTQQNQYYTANKK